MKTLKTLKHIALLVGMLLMSFVGEGQQWVETDEIITGEEYLIGLVDGSDVYLVVNYAPKRSNHYYTSDNNINYLGYTVKANRNGTNLIDIERKYGVNSLIYCTWIFKENTRGGYTIQSKYQDNYYLCTWSSVNYFDLYPDASSLYGKDWKYENKAFYRVVGNTKRYMKFCTLPGNNGNGIGNQQPHMCVTSELQTNNIKLYTKDFLLPINLLEFSAEPRYDQQTGVHVLNLLTIRTGYEYNNCEFIVYRSEDAINWDYDNPVCDWDFGQDSAIYNEALDTVLNYFTIEHPNGQTYYPVDTIPYPVTYYKLIQRDCDNTTTEYTSEIIVCIANQQKNLIEPYVICDNGPQVVGGSEVCEVFVRNVLGQTIEQFLLQPYQQREVLADIQGMYLITFVYKYNEETRKKTEKVVCW